MSDERIKKLLKLRGSQKAKLTHFSNYINIAKSYSSLSNPHRIELQNRLKAIDEAYIDFNKLQTEIETISDDEEKEYAEREQFETVYFTVTALAHSMLEPTPSSGQTSYGGSGTISNEKKDFFRLPDINLPSFDGDLHHWLEFRDMYISLIHDNTRINEISKFHYLRTSLKGNASSVIQSLEFTANNYKIAWELLTERYNNKKILINNHIQALFNVEQVQKDSSKSLRFLVDIINKNLRSLNILDQPTDQWDVLIIFMMSKKLDFISNRQWEEFKSSLSEQPTLKQFITFLNNRAELLETLSSNKQLHKNPQTDTQVHKSKSFAIVTNNTNQIKHPICPLCKQNHYLFSCDAFRALDVNSRINKVSTYHNLCKNCLRTGHQDKNCRLTHCKYCNSRHNTLLHREVDKNTTSNINTENIVLSVHTNSSSNIHSSLAPNHQTNVLLSTAMVKVMDKNGRCHNARALLDNGSTSNFVTSDLCEKLGLPRHNTNSTVIGINSKLSSSTKMCTLSLQACNGSYKASVDCYILPNITTSLPSTFIYKEHIPIPTGVELADPSFNVPSAIDILVGASIFWNILGSNTISLGKHQPTLRESKLGWIVSGSVLQHSSYKNTHTHCHFTQSLESQLSRFWELDSVSSSHSLSKEERECEAIFRETTRRNKEGEFIVTIPLKQSPDVLGYSYTKAKLRFLSVERKLQRDEKLKNDYHNFMREYINLGHMIQITPHTHKSTSNNHSSNITSDTHSSYITKNVHASDNTSNNNPSSITSNIQSHNTTLNTSIQQSEAYNTSNIIQKSTSGNLHAFNKNINNYLPHHGVIRESSTTTKLRVVFDASAATSSGKSFNDIQHIGPTVQDDLLSILLRFRQHKYVVTSDVEKMYRAIQVEPSQRSLQQILFRFDPSEPLHTYILNTVTYGTASAPFLATRCLIALAEQCTDPETKRAIAHDFYMDDYLGGGNSIEMVTKLCRNIINTLDSARFNLRKWRSNSTKILQTISEIKADKDKTLNLNNSSPSKTLGLHWNSESDNFFFLLNLHQTFKVTKRTILSEISQVFDPLGLVGPCIVEVKLIIQQLWKTKSDWDEEVPINLKTSYLSLMQSLPSLNNINIPRWSFNDDTVTIEIHTFSDASERAYGASCYIKTVTSNGNIRVRLLASKNKIAPIKSSTIPRLELCAALLGTRLYIKIIKSLTVQFDRSFFWTDSTIVLGWLTAPSNRLKSFVRNRINEIHESTNGHSWSYVPSKENPADLVSRGARADVLSASSLWWIGPSFLHSTHTQFPVNPNAQTLKNLPEMSFVVNTTENSIVMLINKISDFS